MKERPILFNGDMVRAILDGRKTQTRRVVYPNGYFPAASLDLSKLRGFTDQCPYGQPGDRLWVRETFCRLHAGLQQHLDPDPDSYSWMTHYLADGLPADFESYGVNWTPSIFMPRKLSRITLEIVSVKVERVADISHRDALAEGVRYDVSKTDGAPLPRFRKLWESINKKRGFGWDTNPWVWVIEFKRVI